MEEAKYADMILHVVDASNPQMDEHMQVVYDTLRQLGVSDKKMITLFNKQDLCTDKEQLRDFQADHVLQISAKNGQGLEELKELLADVLREGQIYIERLVPYDQAGSIARIRKYGQVVQEEFLAEGISVKLMCRWRFTVRSEKRRKKRANPYSKVLFPLYKVT